MSRVRSALVLAAAAIAATAPIGPPSAAETVSPLPAAGVQSAAVTVEVQIGDSFFEPQEIRIDPGDTVVWDGGGLKPHSVKSDTGVFDSGRMRAADEFSHTFQKKGSFYYHCTFHGKKQKGMWGVVIVGRPDLDNRPRLVVPDDYASIQEAVDHARPGSAVVVRPGIYAEDVVVGVPHLTIRGIDRFRTILDGKDGKETGFSVSAPGVSIKNLTVRNYTSTGILFDQVTGYTVERVDSINNRTFGIHATNSYDGVVRKSFVWGSGESGVTIDSCFGCGALVNNIRAQTSFTGLWARNATGVTVTGSKFADNGVGLLMSSFAEESSMVGRAGLVYDNRFVSNNNSTIPPSGLSQTYGVPFGTGIWLAGVANTVVASNEVLDHDAFGILVTDDMASHEVPLNNRVVNNTITASGLFDLAWDGAGRDDCFDSNDISGATGPLGLQDDYSCAQRPFEGSRFEPVSAYVDAAIAVGPNRAYEDPPYPERPRCQKGAPGCR